MLQDETKQRFECPRCGASFGTAEEQARHAAVCSTTSRQGDEDVEEEPSRTLDAEDTMGGV
jgi:hypothetical protein